MDQHSALAPITTTNGQYCEDEVGRCNTSPQRAAVGKFLTNCAFYNSVESLFASRHLLSAWCFMSVRLGGRREYRYEIQGIAWHGVVGAYKRACLDAQSRIDSRRHLGELGFEVRVGLGFPHHDGGTTLFYLIIAASKGSSQSIPVRLNPIFKQHDLF